MTRPIFFFLVLLCPYLAFAQEELGNYAEAISSFKTRYNSGNYDEIFNSFDVELKKALPREQTLAFFTENVNGFMGEITEINFDRVERGAHIYHTDFEKAIAEIMISLTPDNKINGFRIKPVRDDAIPILERNTTKMILPFEEEWLVFWGGTTVRQNYHVDYENQKYAYDMMIIADGTTYQGDPTKNESYFAFGKEIISPCDAKVAQVITGVHDNIPGEMNPAQVTGNTIVLETDKGEFLLFAHLKEGSILVEQGQEVRQGDVLGQCGNSGNTTEPHLHLSLQNHEDMSRATGGKLYFDRILVAGTLQTDYLPVKGDLIKNEE